MMMNKLLALIPVITITAFTLIYFKFSIKGWKNIFLCVSGIIGVMMIFIITLSDKKFDEKYRNFCYKNLTSLTKQFRGDLEDYLDDMDDYLTDKVEKEIEEIRELRSDGHISEYYNRIDETFVKWKLEYRDRMIARSAR